MKDRAWGLIHARVHTVLRQQQLLPKQSKILIAVSGGQDSQCLFRLMLDLQRLWAWELGVVHCNHGWREDATLNAEFIQAQAHNLNIPCYILTTSTVLTSENQARAWRYHVFAELADTHDYTHIVTGHTATDQAETLLLHLLRGAGLQGLGAMAWSRSLDPEHPDICLVRPLLNLTRAETAQFCQEYEIPIWPDTTNENLDLRRNRLRLEIMPRLRQYFNPQADQALAQTAFLVQADHAYLEEVAHLSAEIVVNYELQALEQTALGQLHPALQRRIIRNFIFRVFQINPSLTQVADIMALTRAPKNSKSAPLAQNIVAWVEPPWIRFHVLEPSSQDTQA